MTRSLPKLRCIAAVVLLMAFVAPICANAGALSSTEENGRLVELKLTVPGPTAVVQAPRAMQVVCTKNKTRVNVLFLKDFPDGGTITIDWAKGAEPTDWRIASRDGRQIGIEKPIGFLKAWIASEGVVLTAEADGFGQSTEFPMTPFMADGVYQIAKACNWTRLLPGKIDVLKRLETVADPSG